MTITDVLAGIVQVVRRSMPGRLKSLLWMTALGVTAAIAFWSFVRWGPSQEAPPAHEAAQTAAKETGETKPIDTPGPSGSTAPPADVRRQADLTELRRLCGLPWVGEFGPDCLEALERRYGNTVPDGQNTMVLGQVTARDHRTSPWRPVLLGEPVTWAEVFAHPEADLSAVAEAAQRPECLVPEGRFRLDLRRKCAADEMARLAILQAGCFTLINSCGRIEAREKWWDEDGAESTAPRINRNTTGAWRAGASAGSTQRGGWRSAALCWKEY